MLIGAFVGLFIVIAGLAGITAWRGLTDGEDAGNLPATTRPKGTVIWVSDGADGISPGTKNDRGFVDLLTAHGYRVITRYTSEGPSDSLHGPLDDARRQLLNDADLVIVSRCARSDDYNSPADWNSIATPLMLLTPYLGRGDRWRWFDIYDWEPPFGMPALKAAVEEEAFDDLFDGVSFRESGQATVLSDDVVHVEVNGAGNGTVLARRADDWAVWIAHWPAGVEFFPGSGQWSGGPRMYFSAGGHHWDPELAGELNLNDNGKRLFLNAVDRLIESADREVPRTDKQQTNVKQRVSKLSVQWSTTEVRSTGL